jgi:hypothetical protein
LKKKDNPHSISITTNFIDERIYVGLMGVCSNCNGHKITIVTNKKIGPNLNSKHKTCPRQKHKG